MTSSCGRASSFMLLGASYLQRNGGGLTGEKDGEPPTHELSDTGQEMHEDFTALRSQGEDIWADESDPVEAVTITACGKIGYLEKSRQVKFVHKLADKIEEWMEERKFVLDERDYLRQILKYKKRITSFEPLYPIRTKADRWMEEELRNELRRRAGV